MNNLMVDLETLGNGNNAAIVSIGAVFFDPMTGKLGKEFYQVIDIENSNLLGDIDRGTVLWWLRQSSDALAMFKDKNTMRLHSALDELRKFVINGIAIIPRNQAIKVWGNGATFDCVILRNAFIKNGIPVPWKYFNDRDVRTVVEMGRTIANINPKTSIPFTGVKHNALADAKHQAQYVSAIFKALAEQKEPAHV